MKSLVYAICLSAALLAVGGCGKTQQDAQSASFPPCSEISKVTDPDKLAAMKDRCSEGQKHEYTPTKKSNW